MPPMVRWGLVGLLLCSGLEVHALEPTWGEYEYARQLALASNGPPQPKPPAGAIIQVIRHDYARLERQRSVLLTPLQIGGRQFDHGLDTHATSHLQVRLPAGARRFVAKVGIDDNYDTRGQRGSVVFKVHAGGKERFCSPIVRGPDPSLDVSVPVDGQNVLELHVTNADDGDSHDQADWADAAVITEDGKRLWLDEMPIRDLTWLGRELPFSFQFGGKSSQELLASCDTAGESAPIDPSRWQRTVAHLDSDTGLKVTWEAVFYADFPAVEWVLFFENTGRKDTPILEDIRALDVTLRRGGGPRETFVLHAARGGVCTPGDYAPLEIPLTGGESASLGAAGGRSSNRHLPFFNLEAEGRGLAVAVGWSGQWHAEFAADQKGYLRVTAGMENTRLRLRPGERVRSPRILVVCWEGDRLRGHNLLRRLIYRHHTPPVDGKRPLPGVQCNTWFPVGDFYPLMDHSVDPMQWTGYQFHRDDLQEGMVLLFRRERSPYLAVQIRLRGLQPDKTYELTFDGTLKRRTLSGRELSEPMRIEIDEPAGSVLILYRPQ